MEFSQAVKTCFKKKYFTISGRASRSEFWWFQVFIWGSILLMVVSALLIGATGASEGPMMVVVVAISVFYLSLIVPSITGTVRRFHDIDMSGWWVLGFLILNVIPYLGIISGIVMLYFLAKKGTSGDNRFGWDPVGNTQSADIVPTVIPADTSNHAYLIKNEAVLSDGGPKTATSNRNSSSIQHEPSLDDIEASSEVPAERDKVDPYQYDKARKVIEYNEEAERYWNKVQLLPESYQNLFLQALSDDPLTDLEALAKRLQQENLKELRPYEDDEANELLERCRAISETAASEFMEVYKLLGKKADLNYAFAKIEAKFTPERLAEDAKRIRIERQKAERAAVVAASAAEYHRREAEKLAKEKPK